MSTSSGKKPGKSIKPKDFHHLIFLNDSSGFRAFLVQFHGAVGSQNRRLFR